MEYYKAKIEELNQIATEIAITYDLRDSIQDNAELIAVELMKVKRLDRIANLLEAQGKNVERNNNDKKEL